MNMSSSLGELRSVHRPAKPRLWPILALSAPLLLITALCIVLVFDSFTGLVTGSKQDLSGSVSNYFIGMGIVGVLLAILSGIFVSDYRAWSATRTVKLSIYEEGFTYESQGRMEVCRWDQVGKIKTRFIDVITKAFRTRVKIIRAIVKNDGTIIEFARTLNLREITELITTANGFPRNLRPKD